ncbi:MAG TPA: acyltransferase family protein [Acidimicrobiales bacterium]
MAQETDVGGRPRLRHVAGLDGIRALAVLAVIAFHTGLSSVPGGFYGVDAFFVLSGFLITSLLVTEWEGTGTISLRRFWGGRARRLLPALFLLVAAVGVALVAYPSLLATPHVIGDALSTVFYASNWYSIHGGVSYFSTAAQPSPLLHTWSLAIEEQFYLVWPLVVLFIMKVGTGGRRQRRRHQRISTVRVIDGSHLMMFPRSAEADAEWIRRRRLHLLFGLSSLGALGSSLLMAYLAPAGYTTRAYYGTDTRAQALLVGAAVASGLALWRDGASAVWFRRLGGVLGIVGVAGTAVLWTRVSETSTFAFSGGFLLASLAAGMVILGAVVAPRGPTVRLLEIPPLPALGRISYGVYLWYWPVLLVMSGARLHWGVYPLFAARVGVTVTIAALSARFIELPIRRGALPSWRSLVAAPVGAAAALGLVCASTLVPVSAASLQGSSVVPNDPPTTTPGTGTAGGAAAGPSDLIPPLSASSASAPAPTTGGPIKVLLVGDSVAGTLGVGLSQYQANDHVQIVNEGIPGCSLSMDQSIKVLFYTLPPGQPCAPGDDPVPLLTQWKKWIDAYNPDVVIYLARGETFDQEEGGKWRNLGQAAFNQFVADRYRQAIDVMGSKGAAVVLMTTPYYDSGTSPSGTIWPEDQVDRVTVDNRLIRQAAVAGTASTGHQVYVFDLNAVVSPGNQYATAVAGVNLRCSDGVHFSPTGGEFVGLQLLHDLAELGVAHHATSPTGAWAGALPPSTPPWYAKLPC